MVAVVELVPQFVVVSGAADGQQQPSDSGRAYSDARSGDRRRLEDSAAAGFQTQDYKQDVNFHVFFELFWG